MIDEKGLTLVEAITTLAIAVVVSTLLVVIMINTGGLFTKQSSKVEQGLSVNDALGKINSSIRQSSGVLPTYSTYTSGAQLLVLKIPSIDSSGNVVTNTFDHFIFLLEPSTGSGQVLRFKVFPNIASSRGSVDQIFSNNVSLLNFEYFDSQNPPEQVIPSQATKVKTTLLLKQKSGVGFEQNIATSEANLRND